MSESKRINSFGRMTRRRFVGRAAAVAGAAGLAGYLPESLARAASMSPQKFDLSQVKHLVFQMQENRSFDHYFGTFPGARGFSDPTAIRLPTGRSVFQQPDPSNPDMFLEPYHMSTITTGAAAVPSLSHDWRDQHASWNQGLMDAWLLTHVAADGDVNGLFTMGYYLEEDLPFHWALARAFTLCDAYHCSVLGPTDTNRLHWESGSCDPQGLAGGPMLETGGVRDLTYETVPETLYKVGITYKFYQNVGWPQDTILTYFRQFQAPGAVPQALYNSVLSDGTLWGNGNPGQLGNPADPTPASNGELGFEEDCANGTLPDVSFIGSNSFGDEHPPAIPAAGAEFLATKLEALAANEDLWNTTVFIISYDENDGIFDHVVPPTPDPDKYPEEFVHLASPAGTPGGGLPVGAGFRVPAFVISPWTTGGHIFSQVNDHTSCLRLIEAVANAGGLSGNQTGELHFPNISRWRRATMGDFTDALRPVPAQPAPTSTEFDPATTAANYAAQAIAAAQPMPARPGADQQTSLTLSPASALVLVPGASKTVTATFSNNGPGSFRKASLSLSGAPSDCTVTATTATTAATMHADSALTASWQVAVPADAAVQAPALSVTASYTQAGAAKTTSATQASISGFNPDDLVLLAVMTASSTHPGWSPSYLNDGNTSSVGWGSGVGWNDDTPGVFPDWVTATWDQTVTLSQVVVYTLDTPTSPASAYGVRDYDVQVATTDGEWQTVAQVTDNVAGSVTSSFAAVQTTALRILILDSNDHTYSRLIAVEAFSD